MVELFHQGDVGKLGIQDSLFECFVPLFRSKGWVDAVSVFIYCRFPLFFHGGSGGVVREWFG